MRRFVLRPALLIVPALLALAPLPAAEAAATRPAAPKAVVGAEKVTITGDNFVVDDVKHQAIFTGNVVVVQPEVTVHSDKVVAFYGAGGGSNIRTFEATGHVVLVTPEQTATGQLAVFDPKSHLLTLTGNVVVTNKSGQVQSTKLVVDLRTKKSVFSAAGGRVTGVFTSE